MRSVFQRVKSASVDILDGEKYRSGEIGKGAMILVAVENGDTDDDAKWLANKMAGMRVYEDADGKMNLSLKDVGGDALVVSEISRLGRSMSDLNKLVNDELKPKKLRLIVISMGLDLDCANLKAIDEKKAENGVKKINQHPYLDVFE